MPQKSQLPHGHKGKRPHIRGVTTPKPPPKMRPRTDRGLQQEYPPNGTYSARKGVPKRLQGVNGLGRELTESLRTNDIALARSRLPHVMAKFEARLKAAEQGKDPSSIGYATYRQAILEAAIAYGFDIKFQAPSWKPSARLVSQMRVR